LNKKIKKLNEDFYSKEFSNKTPNLLTILNNQSLSFINDLESIKKTLDSLIQSEKNFQQKIERICDEYFKRKVGFKFKEIEEGIRDSK
jgi:tRNA 2-selenouridine synthase SelU